MQSKFLLTLFSALLLSNGVLGSLRPRGFQGQGFHHGGGRNGNGFGGTKTTTTIAAAKTSTTTTSSSSTQTAITNNANNNGGNSNPQTSFTLLQSVIQSNSNIDGTETGVNGSTTAGIVASAKSPNNFINFCATSSKPLMNGVQIRTGACNPIPMGEIGNFDTAPQTKIAFPTNNGNIAANTNFTVLINMKNFAVGTFTNADSTYYTAPCQLDASGTPIGHTHIVIQAISSLDSTTPLAPNKFAFFLGLKGGINGNGQVTGAVPGLPAGTYRLSTINTCGNHQSLNGAIAQRGAFDDQVYFTVGGSGTGSGSTSTTTTNNGGTGTTNNGGTGTTNNGGTGTTNNGGTGTTNNGGKGTTNNGGTGTTNNGGTGTTNNGGTGTANNGGKGTTNNGGTGTANNGGTGTANNGGKGTTNNGGTGTTNNGGTGTTNNGGTGATNNGGKGTTSNGGTGTTNNGGTGTTNNGGKGTTNNGGTGTTNNGGTGTTNNGGTGTTTNGGNGKQHGKVKRDSLLAKRRIQIDGIEAY